MGTDLSEKYLPLSEMVREIGRYVVHAPESHEATVLSINKAYLLLKNNHKLRRQVEDTLESEGFRRLNFLCNGQFALVFITTHDQMLRICKAEHNAQGIIVDEVSKPIREIRLSDGKHALRISVFKRLNTSGVNNSHTDAVGASLIRKGYLFWDPRVDNKNVGLLPDGTPLVLDDGSVKHIRDIDNRTEEYQHHYFKSLPEPAYKWEGKQEHFCPELLTSALHGVAGSKELRGLVESLGSEGQSYAKLIKHKGHYIGGLLNDLGRAAEYKYITHDDRPLVEIIQANATLAKRTR